MNSMLLPASGGALLLGAVLLFFSITRMLALLRQSEVASLPVVAEQEVSFAAPGVYALNIEQPRLSMAMRGVGFGLRDANGREVPSTPIIFRTTSAGFSSARISERSFDIARAGAYRLLISGVKPGADVSAVRLVFTNPYTAKLVLLILGTVLGGICLIGGMVFMSLRLTGKL